MSVYLYLYLYLYLYAEMHTRRVLVNIVGLAHIRQSRPGSGLGFQVRVIQFFLVIPSSAGLTCRDVQPSELHQIGFFNRLDFGHTPPNFGVR